MDILNEDVLEHIFKFLGSIDDLLAVSAVCIKWRDVMSEHIWKKMTVFAVDTKPFPKENEILTVQKLIQLLNLAGPHILYAHLELENTYITRIHLGQHLFSLDDDDFIATQDLIEILAESSGNIEKLELVDCDQQNGLLRSLFLMNNSLRKIKFKDCNLQTIFDNDIVLPSVKKLELNLRLDFLEEPLQMINLYARLPNLEELETVLELILTTDSCYNVEWICWSFRRILPDGCRLKTLKLYFLNEYYFSARLLKSVANSFEYNSIIYTIDAEIIDYIVSQIRSKCAHLERLFIAKPKDKLVLSNDNVWDLFSLQTLREIKANDVVFLKELRNYCQTVRL